MLALLLRHLPRSHLKGEPLPFVATVGSLPFASGWYIAPHAGLYALPDDRRVPAHNGVIVLSESDETDATLTHELRHHLQQLRRRLPDSSQPFSFDGTLADYWRAVECFFRAAPHELDALRYEVRHCPTDLNCEQLDVVLHGWR